MKENENIMENEEIFDDNSNTPVFPTDRHYSQKRPDQNEIKNKVRSLTNYTASYNYSFYGKDKKKYKKKGDEDLKLFLERKRVKRIRKQLRLYYAKDYILLFVLFTSSSFNFSLLYLPYIFFGLLYIFLAESLSYAAMKLKYFCEIFIIGYSGYSLVFKGLAIALLKTESDNIILDRKKLFLDLGICCLKDMDSLIYLISTFGCEVVVIIVSGFSIFASFQCRLLKPTDAEIKIVTNLKLRKYMVVIYFFLVGYTMFNLSYLSLVYIVTMQVVLLFSSLQFNDKFIKKLLKGVTYFLALTIFLQIVAVNIFNIPSIQAKLEEIYTAKGLINGQKIYSVLKKIGINHDEYTDYKDILQKFAGNFFGVITLLMLINTINKLQSDAKQTGNNHNEIVPKKTKSNFIISWIIFFLSHPVFNFELSRVLSIFWTYHYRNYYSLGILFFIFISFFSVHTKSNKNLILYILTPMLGVTLCSFHISNIDGVCENLEHDTKLKYLRYAVGKYDYLIYEYLIGHLFFIIVVFCINSMFSVTSKEKRNADSDSDRPKVEMKKIQTFRPQKDVQKLTEAILPKDSKDSSKDSDDDGMPFNTLHSINDERTNTSTSSFSIEKKKEEEFTSAQTEKKVFIQRKNNLLVNPMKDVKFSQLVLKGILMHIDKITLVVMYLVSVYTVNLIHVVLVFIFIMQIISPGKLNYCYKFNAFLFQLLYLIEFIIDLLKVYYIELFNEYKEFFDFLIVYNEDISSNDLELFIYGVIYCFYFQYRTYNIETINGVLKSKNISVKNFIQQKLKNYPKLQEYVLSLGKVTNHVYLWSLICLFIFFNSYFEINFIFGCKLIIFFICCYTFIYYIQLPKEETTVSCLKVINRIFLFVCCLNTFIVYLFQFINKDFLGLKKYVINDIYGDFYLKNLPNFGFTIYKDENLYYNFFPHFMTTFIAVLFIWETESILNDIINTYSQRRTTISHYLIMQKNKKKQEQEKIDKIKAEENEFVQDKLYSDKYDENDDNIQDKSKKLLKIHIILFFTKCYLLGLIFSFVYVFTTYDLSYSTLIYIVIVSLICNKMFHRIISKLTNYIKNPSYYISKVIRYTIVEKPKHYEINRRYRLKLFRCLLFFSLLYYVLIYFYGVFDLFQHGCNPDLFIGCDSSHLNIIEVDEDDDIEHNSLEALVKSYAFLFGIYYDVRKENILKISLVHLILTLAICFDVYNQKIGEHYHTLCDTLQEEVQKLINENNVLQKYSDIADLNILIKIGLSIAGIQLKPQKNGRNGSRVSLQEQFRQSSDDTDSLINNNNNNNNNRELISNQTTQIIEENDEGEENEDEDSHQSQDKKNNKEEEDEDEICKVDEPKEDVVESYDLNENAPANSFLKSKRIKKFIDMFKSSNDNETQLSIGNSKDRVIRFLKKFVEEIMIFILICIALAKLNALTFVYLFITFILIATKKTMWKFFLLSCFLYFSIIVQSLSFVSNINTTTSSRDNKIIFEILDKRMNIPWYKRKFPDEKDGYFLGLGVCKSQIRSIWWEILQILIIHCYLDFFSYSKYQDVLNLGESSMTDQKFDFDSLNMNPQSIGRLTKMTEMEFMQYKHCLKSFDFNIGESVKDFLKLLKLSPKAGEKASLNFEHKPNLNLSVIKNEVLKDLIYLRQYNKDISKNLEKQDLKQYKPLPQYLLVLQEILYMYLHCFLLIFIIIISIMIAGLLSTIYFSVCFYYLIKSDSLYLGQEYSYPKALKKVLRIILLIDITLQGIYQIPVFDWKKDQFGFLFFKALGLIRAVNFSDIDNQINTFQTVELFGKPLMYFFMSIQVLIYESKNFKRYYLVYLLEHKQELKKYSLINSFTYNNKRVKMYEKSLNIRQKTDQAMDDLKQIIIELNEKLNKVGKKLFDKKTNTMKEKTTTDIIEKFKKKESEEIKNNINHINNIDNNINDNKNKLQKVTTINQLSVVTSILDKKNNEDKNNNDNNKQKIYLEPEDIKNKIKEILYSGFMTHLYLWFHKHSASYKSIEAKAKFDYDMETIKGKTKINSLIENDINRDLSILSFENIDKNDMAGIVLILEAYFDEEKRKFLEEQKLKEIKSQTNINKFKKFGNNLLKLIKFSRMIYGVVKTKDGETKSSYDQKKKKDLLELFKKQIEKERQEKEIKEKEEKIRKEKLRQFEELLDTKLFKKYLKTSYQIKHIIIYLQSFFINNFNWFCYFIMILDHMLSASLITIIYPISIFCYAILEYPRPKKTYWLVILYYTLIVICVKSLIQMKVIFLFLPEEGYSNLIQYFYYNRIGIKYYSSTFSSEFLSYIIFDALVVLNILINRNLLISDGLWNKREDEIENIYEASERIAIFRTKKHESKIQAYKDLVIRYLYSQKESARKITQLKRDQKSGIRFKFKFFSNKSKEEEFDEAGKSYYNKLFTKVRNEKPGNDYYAAYTLSLFLICIYILLFYTQMDQDRTYGAVNLETTQFSGTMVIYLILHITILIFDRIIFVLQNREDIKYEYIFYRRNEKNFQGELISEQELSLLKSEIVKNNINIKFHNIPTKDLEKLKKKFNIIFIQNELFNKPLLNKYLLHIFTTLFSHVMIFLYFPIKGNNNLGNSDYCTDESAECNDFTKNNYIIFFYMFYLIYLVFSGLQIKYGFYDIKRKSIFKRGDDELVSGLANVFQAIPFLYELKNAIDWTFTSTCLDLFQWNKFEAIYDRVFDTYCDKNEWDERPVGRRVSRKKKLSMGATLSFSLIFILIIPLILFSSLNPTNKLNNITAAKINVALAFTYENGAIKKYNLFANARADSISEMSADETDEIWNNNNYSASVQTRNFNHDQVQRIIFAETSDTNWDLANPHIKNLIRLLDLKQDNDLVSIGITIDYELTRPLPAEAQTCSNSFSVPIFSSTDDPTTSEGAKKIADLKDALENCYDINITIDNAYSAPLRLTSASEVTSIEDSKYFPLKSIQIGFQGCSVEASGKANYFNSYYTVQTIEYKETNNTNNTNDDSFFTFLGDEELNDSDIEGKNNTNYTISTTPLELHTFSDQISETTQGYSVLTFYISFVLLAGTYIRDFLANEPEKIMLGEMPHSKKIVDLCEGIKIARYSYDFKNEEYLYTILIELMRSPDYLKVITDSSLDHFKQREELNNKEE